MADDLDRFNEYTRDCFKEAPPPCRCCCPFKLDVRSFTGRMARGKVDSAFREYRNAVIFPEIVSRLCDAPCEAVCVRKDNDGAPVSLQGLEEACIAYSKDRKPVRYSLPQKKDRVAVIGAGPSGLACALKLASRGAPVTVFFREGETGGSLLGLAERDVFRCEIETELEGLPIEYRPNTVVGTIKAFQTPAETGTHTIEYRTNAEAGAAAEFQKPEATGTHTTEYRTNAVECATEEFQKPEGTRTQTIEYRANASVGAAEPLFEEGFGAVYVATGMGGEDFGLLEGDGFDRDSLGSSKPGVFVGGEILGATKAQAIENGARAARSIEKYLQLGLMDGMPETYEQWAVNEEYYRPIPKAAPEDTGSKEGAAKEAGRCKDCECSLCIDACPMLEEAKRTPKKLTDDVTVTVNKIEEQTRRVANRLMNACNECGLCKEICPVDVDIGGCLLEARKAVFAQGGMPPAFHDYYLRDMEHALSEEAYFEFLPEGGLRYLFFPGCQSGASSPDYVLKPFAAMRSHVEDGPACGILVSCCGAPAEWAGDEELARKMYSALRDAWEKAGKPTLVCSCLTCRDTVTENLPEIPVISFLEWIDNQGIGGVDKEGIAKEGISDKGVDKGGIVNAEKRSGPAYLFDPCSSRYDDGARVAARNILAKADIEYQTGSMSGRLAECCGYGGHIYASNPGLYGRVVDLRISESDLPYIAYCSNCRDAFAAKGKDCIHIFDVLFGSSDRKRPAPRISERIQNRRLLKRKLSELYPPRAQNGSEAPQPESRPLPESGSLPDSSFLSEDGPQSKGSHLSEGMPLPEGRPIPENGPPPSLIIADDIYEKMEQELVSYEDVRKIILDAEETGEKFFDAETESFLSSGPVGVSTCWVVYRQEGDSIRLSNIYTHRMYTAEGS